MAPKSYRHRRRRRLAEYQKNLCFFCDKPMLFVPEDTHDGNHPLVASDDHFIPRSKGGRGTLANLVVAHRDCNSRHNNLMKDAEYEQKLYDLNKMRGLELDKKSEIEPFGSLDTFTAVTPASVAFFSRLNSLPPEHIAPARKIIVRFFTKFHYALKQFQSMPDKQFRYKLFKDWINFSVSAQGLSILSNIISTMMILWFINTYRIFSLRMVRKNY